MSLNGRNIPLPIQKQLRQEANFGCVLCGCPLMEYAHIISYRDIQAYLPENIIALCPNHYTDFDRGEFSESYLRDAKKNPHNKIQEKDAFFIDSQDMAVNVGKSKFINTSRILAVNDFDIISINRENERYILLDINFFDKLNNLIAVVYENSWRAEKRASAVWEIGYKPHHLMIRNTPSNLFFEAKIENEELFITANMYYSAIPLSITNDGIWLGESEMAVDLKGCVLKNYDIGINAQTYN
jgi:trigger factor